MNTSINNINVSAIEQLVRDINESASNGLAHYQITSQWAGQTRVNAIVESFALGNQSIQRNFVIAADEPGMLLGTDTAPNPQELLMAAMNACFIVGYVASASVRGIRIEKLEIETSGTLDLRGFLALDANVKPGFDVINYTICVKGDGTAEQFAELHEHIKKVSPNYFNLSQPVRLNGALLIE